MTRILACMDTPGGHMFITLMLIFFGFGILIVNPPTTASQLAHDLVVGATGVLFGAMKGQNGSKITVTPKQDPSTEPQK